MNEKGYSSTKISFQELQVKLHITNGDCAGDMIRAAAGIEGEILCWRDLLHDGPLFADKTVHRRCRIEYLQELLKTTHCAESRGFGC